MVDDVFGRKVYTIEDNIINNDNQSAIFMDKNGRN